MLQRYIILGLWLFTNVADGDALYDDIRLERSLIVATLLAPSETEFTSLIYGDTQSV